MPAIMRDGKIIMETTSKIAMHPDEGGAPRKALGRSDLLAMFEDLAIEIISYFQVENPLARCIDPYLLRSHLKSQSQASSRMIRKFYVEEKIGIFVK
jgi:UDP-N-acetylglucosamine/UDP-N-acetylgalactosamine diphosphorylase